MLVNVEYERFRYKMYDINVSEETYNNFFEGAQYRILGYEAGEITTEEFAYRCINELGLKMTNDEFADAFNDMFSEITEMSTLVKGLAENRNHDLFLLSNTNPLHFAHIKKNYEYVNLLHDFALSYELKALKPDDVIYERTIAHLGVVPGESLFTYDLKENCDAAEKFGFNTINYRKNDHKEFLRRFETLISS